MVAVLTMVLAACSVPGTQTSSTGQAGPVDGVWRTDGYGWVIAVN
ncbi:MAG: hypothetical protein QOI68_4625, partial [Pseudonocardiales bacterium]|nr:hypothetical protein [Pseudonocardiales bacterium]